MSHRATKSGLAKETQDKVIGKYSNEEGHELLEWINGKVGGGLNTSGDLDNFREVLLDGTVLCKLSNALGGRIPANKIKSSTMAFKRMELIGMFINDVSGQPFNIPDHERFATVDLNDYPGNPNQICVCLNALKRKVGEGIKEASENKRNFTEEQLRAGDNIIGLQMGTNKGASQKGMNIGNTRHIVD